MGVWIETVNLVDRYKVSKVTPYVGVWIETMIYPMSYWDLKKSLLMWECGLKPVWALSLHRACRVTPYVGVWIETFVRCNTRPLLASLLMWECGLKP